MPGSTKGSNFCISSSPDIAINSRFLFLLLQNGLESLNSDRGAGLPRDLGKKEPTLWLSRLGSWEACEMRGLAPIAQKLAADRRLDVVSAESDRIFHLIRAESGDDLVLEIEVLHWLVLKNSFEILL
jgi:hypothetical protein